MLSFWKGFRIFCLVNIVYGQQTVVQPPTNATSTDELYVTSAASNFQFDIINCGTTNCHIICGEVNACFSIQVYASCEELSVTGPSTTLDISCEGPQSCATGTIYAAKTTNVNIACNYSSTTSVYGTCDKLFLNASRSSSVIIDCLGQFSCFSSNFYVNNAASVSIHAEGLYVLLSSYLYANEMTNELDIICNGDQSCSSMSIFANYMSNNVLLSCNGHSSCANTNLYADYMTGMTTINCNGDFGCNNIEFDTRKLAFEMLVVMSKQNVVELSMYYLSFFDDDISFNVIEDDIDQQYIWNARQWTDELASNLSGKAFLNIAQTLIKSELESNNWKQCYSLQTFIQLIKHIKDINGWTLNNNENNNNNIWDNLLPKILDLSINKSIRAEIKYSALFLIRQLINNYQASFCNRYYLIFYNAQIKILLNYRSQHYRVLIQCIKCISFFNKYEVISMTHSIYITKNMTHSICIAPPHYPSSIEEGQ